MKACWDDCTKCFLRAILLQIADIYEPEILAQEEMFLLHTLQTYKTPFA